MSHFLSSLTQIPWGSHTKVTTHRNDWCTAAAADCTWSDWHYWLTKVPKVADVTSYVGKKSKSCGLYLSNSDYCLHIDSHLRIWEHFKKKCRNTAGTLHFRYRKNLNHTVECVENEKPNNDHCEINFFSNVKVEIIIQCDWLKLHCGVLVLFFFF